MKEFLVKNKDFITKTAIICGILVITLVTLDIIDEIFDILFDFIDF